jgi:hypothetical protein
MKIGCGFSFQWVFVTFVGFLVSLYWIEIGERTNVGSIEGAIGGAVIGLAQWFVIRQTFSQAGWWILASIISWGLISSSNLGALGWVAPATLQLPVRVVYGSIYGAVVGTVIGVAQWFVLRKQMAKAWQWILTSAFAWAIGLSLGWVVGGVLRKATGLFLAEVVGLMFVWLVVAAITSSAFYFMARKR